EHEASQIMLNNFYEKNPHWNEKWEEMNKKKIWDFCKNYYFILSDRSKKLELSLERFKTTFGIEKFSNQVLIKQIYLVLKRSNVNLLYKSFYKRGNY
ncbi:MAG: hypothetical protein JW802_11515, partial [Campylobacterales bacterium]|nr:hypothetical protein [Campylobacterales bacterium]